MDASVLYILSDFHFSRFVDAGSMSKIKKSLTSYSTFHDLTTYSRIASDIPIIIADIDYACLNPFNPGPRKVVTTRRASALDTFKR